MCKYSHYERGGMNRSSIRWSTRRHSRGMWLHLRHKIIPWKWRPTSTSWDGLLRPAVIGNLQNESWTWAQLLKVLMREGEALQTSGCLYMKVVQAILLFGDDKWVVNPHYGKNLGGLQHQVAMRITGKKPQKWADAIVSTPLWWRKCGRWGWSNCKCTFQ